MSTALKNRLKNYSFWVSLASAVLLLVQAIGKPLGLIINEEIYMSIVNSVLGVFVVLGIISHPAQNLLSSKDTQTETDTITISESTTQNNVSNGINAEEINTNIDSVQNNTDSSEKQTNSFVAENSINGALNKNSNENSPRNINKQIIMVADTANSSTSAVVSDTTNSSLDSQNQTVTMNDINKQGNNTTTSLQNSEIIVNGFRLQTNQQPQSHTQYNANSFKSQVSEQALNKNDIVSTGGIEEDNKSDSANSSNNSTIA